MIRKNNPLGGSRTKKLGCWIAVQTCQNILKDCTGNVDFAFLAKPNLKILFEIKKFKIIYNIRKEPFNGRADCIHGTVVSLLLGSQYSLPERCLEMYP